MTADPQPWLHNIMYKCFALLFLSILTSLKSLEIDLLLFLLYKFSRGSMKWRARWTSRWCWISCGRYPRSGSRSLPRIILKLWLTAWPKSSRVHPLSEGRGQAPPPGTMFLCLSFGASKNFPQRTKNYQYCFLKNTCKIAGTCIWHEERIFFCDKVCMLALQP